MRISRGRSSGRVAGIKPFSVPAAVDGRPLALCLENSPVFLPRLVDLFVARLFSCPAQARPRSRSSCTTRSPTTRGILHPNNGTNAAMFVVARFSILAQSSILTRWASITTFRLVLRFRQTSSIGPIWKSLKFFQDRLPSGSKNQILLLPSFSICSS